VRPRIFLPTLVVLAVVAGATTSCSVSISSAPSSTTTTVAAPPGSTTQPVDHQVPGSVVAGGVVAVTAYDYFAGSIDKACAAIDANKFVSTMAKSFGASESDARTGLKKTCERSAHQVVEADGAANGLLAIRLHESGYGLLKACQMKDELATRMAKEMVDQGRPELTEEIFLKQITNSCPQ
jgi:hypothetical protein